MPLNIDWQQILLHLFNFAILFGVLYFLLYSPVKQFMDNRVKYYKDIDDEAKLALENAEKTKEEYQKKLDLIDNEISDKKKKAYEEIDEVNKAKIKHAEQEAEKILKDARETIENQRAKMLKEAKSEIADMVTGAAQKLIASNDTAQAFDQFLDLAKRGEADE